MRRHNETSELHTCRCFALSLALVCCTLLALVGAGRAEPRGAKACNRYCVSVAPARGTIHTVFRFSGRGWRPRRVVTILHGVYCKPHSVCPAVGVVEHLRSDENGRFLFRFRNGPGPRHPTDIPRPSAQGGGPVSFRQVRRRGRHVVEVVRTPVYCVNGQVPGSPMQPCPVD
jgi:hypothetical protein